MAASMEGIHDAKALREVAVPSLHNHILPWFRAVTPHLFQEQPGEGHFWGRGSMPGVN